MSKHKIFIPQHLRAYRPRPLRWLGKILMKVTGWKTSGDLPKDERVVLIAGPHTSNWDFVLAMSLILSLDVQLNMAFQKTRENIYNLMKKFMIENNL